VAILKKQSQFTGDQNEINTLQTRAYGRFVDFVRQKNKAKQTQYYLAPRFSGGRKPI